MVETRNFFATMLVDSSIPDADPEGRMRIRQKPEETPVTLAAKRSDLGRVYLDWAQYPVVETGADRDRVTSFDSATCAMTIPDRSRRGVLSASVELDRNLNVVRESFRIAQPSGQRNP